MLCVERASSPRRNVTGNVKGAEGSPPWSLRPARRVLPPLRRQPPTHRVTTGFSVSDRLPAGERAPRFVTGWELVPEGQVEPVDPEPRLAGQHGQDVVPGGDLQLGEFNGSSQMRV